MAPMTSRTTRASGLTNSVFHCVADAVVDGVETEVEVERGISSTHIGTSAL